MIGLAFCKLVYAKSAIVWITVPTEAKAITAMEEINASAPYSTGNIYQAAAFARRYAGSGVLTAGVHPRLVSQRT